MTIPHFTIIGASGPRLSAIRGFLETIDEEGTPWPAVSIVGRPPRIQIKIDPYALVEHLDPPAWVLQRKERGLEPETLASYPHTKPCLYSGLVDLWDQLRHPTTEPIP